MSNTQVVVCTPTIHREFKGVRLDHLDRTIESVLSQSYPHLEQIVVRDVCAHPQDCELCGRTDEMMNAYMAKDARLHYLVLPKHEDPYGYFGRNLAIRNSETPLIAYCDDDVWWERHHLEHLIEALSRTDASFAYAGSTVCDYQGKVILRRFAKRPYFTGIDLNEIVHRRELITRHGEWALNYNADWMAVHTWLQNGARAVGTRQFTSHYAIKPGFSARFWFWYSYWKHRLPRLFS